MKRISILAGLVVLAASLASAGDASSTAGGVVAVKELLAELPESDRHEFLENLTFGDGRVVSAYKPPLERTLKSERVVEVLEALSPRASAVAKAAPSRGKRTPLVRPSQLLKGVPPSVRRELLDSMTFADGKLVSVYAGGLRDAVGAKKAKKILDALYAFADDGKPRDPKSLCGNGWCDNSACTSVGSDPRKCLPKDKWACASTCR